MKLDCRRQTLLRIRDIRYFSCFLCQSWVNADFDIHISIYFVLKLITSYQALQVYLFESVCAHL